MSNPNRSGDLVFMQRCIDLALLGAGQVSPNPMVGAVLVHERRIIAENYHQKHGGPHAEVLVIQDVLDKFGESAHKVLAESTLYVSLEPCSHMGKTPPCAHLIIDKKIPRVVIAMEDPTDKVNGKGIQLLRQAGVDVQVGMLKQEATWLNRRFITQHKEHRPYIILKWAETADGYMAPLDRSQKWISGPQAKTLVHKWRSEEDAILVGKGTALADNPQLDVREWTGRNPKRILIDRNLVISEDAAIYNDAADTIVFNAEKALWEGKKKYIALENFDFYLPQNICYQLYLMDIQSLIVEGGYETLKMFIEAGLWDEARVITSKSVVWGEGYKIPALEGKLRESGDLGRDAWQLLQNWRDF